MNDKLLKPDAAKQKLLAMNLLSQEHSLVKKDPAAALYNYTHNGA